jgi:predicted XRE-type DNA-binding protein
MVMSKNVFVDAGYSPDVAAVKALRSDLAFEIAQYIERHRYTQVNAARALGIPQPTVSKIINGRVSDLSMEFLLRVLVRAGIPMVLQTGSSVNHAVAEIGIGKSLDTPSVSASAPGTQFTELVHADAQALCVVSGADTGTGTSEGRLNG